MMIRTGAAVAAALLVAGTAIAGTGDIHRVTAERLNVRAGPTNEADVRTQIQQGTRVVEVGSEEGWVGIRVMATGEEGWVFGDYLEPVSRSTLDVEMEDGPFAALSRSFDTAVERANERLGLRTVASIEQAGENTLRVVPTAQWLRRGSHDAHLMAAVAFYQLWKNHRDGSPVDLVMTDTAGEPYIRISDEADGPVVTIPSDEPKG